MEKKLKELFIQVLKVPSAMLISDDTSPVTLPAWDSINHLNLIVSAEEKFQIEIEPEEISTMMSDFKTFKSILLNKLNAEL